MKRLNKENIFLLLTVVALTLAFVAQIGSIDELMTTNKQIFIQLVVLLTVVMEGYLW